MFPSESRFEVCEALLCSMSPGRSITGSYFPVMADVQCLQVSLAHIFISQLGSASWTFITCKFSAEHTPVVHADNMAKPAHASVLQNNVSYMLVQPALFKTELLIILSCHVMFRVRFRQRNPVSVRDLPSFFVRCSLFA